MKRTLTLPSALLFTLALLTPSLQTTVQDPDPDQDPPEETEDPEAEARVRDIFGRLRRPQKGELDPLEGVWQLLEVDIVGFPKEGMEATGYLLIQDGHMAFQLEAVWPDDEWKDSPEDAYQAFVAEFTREGSTLACRTLVGAYLDEEDETFEFEDPGGQREFEVTIEGNFLTLEWGKSDTLTFGRRRAPQLNARTIFGTRSEDLPAVDPEIFGKGDGDEKKGEQGDGQRRP